MPISRRQFLLAASSTLAAPLIHATPARPRVVIVGGGWGGLAAARHLAAACDVLLVERQAEFISLPLANRLLAGLDDGRRLRQDYRAAADALGYRYLQAEVHDIERERRQIVTTAGSFAYDWLIVAAGIAEDASSLAGGNAEAAALIQRRFASAFAAGPALSALPERLAAFNGGEFLIALPPAPYRCPPAPYERAVIVAQAIKARRLKAHLTVLEPNAPWPAYQRIFDEFYRTEVTYLPNTRLRQLDPFKQVAALDFEEIPFAEALIMPPQQAAPLCRQAGLNAPDSAWAAVDPRTFATLADERIFVVGDSVGSVSPIFGHYPKTGQLAARMGQIAAAEILARSAGRSSEPALPDSTCFAYLTLSPPQITRIETHYRRRGDGVLLQSVQQQRENNPQGENDAWLDAWHGELFGSAARR